MSEPDVAAAIKALETIELVCNQRGQYQLEQDLTKAQESIVETLGMTKGRLAEKDNGQQNRDKFQLTKLSSKTKKAAVVR